MKAERIQALAKQFGALRCAEIDARQIDYDRSFRDMCEMNSCGVYGKNYMCPPSVGPIDELMAEAKRYPQGVLYQTVFPLEDSFDFEGMIEAKKKHARLSSRLQVALTEEIGGEFLHLSGGGCPLCERCGILDGIPCRNPKLALSSLEAYGINVSVTAGNAGLPYINGKDTVTYFGAVLFEE